MPRAGGGRAAGWALAAVLALFSSAGCNVLEAREWNLRELHNADADQPGVRVHRKSAVLLRDFEFILQRLTRRTIRKVEEGQRGVEDPYKECLKNLVKLARLGGDSPRVLVRQAEFYSWLAVDDDYVLSRERAVVELGHLAARLGLEDVPTMRATEVPHPTAAEMSVVLGALVGASEIPSGTEGAETRAAALGRACQAVRAIDLDRNAGRRVLAVSSALLDRMGRARPDVAELIRLELDVARQCTAWALAEAQHDESPFVRAAALSALASLGDAARDTYWGDAMGDPEAVIRRRVMQLIGAHGIPAEPGSERHEAWLALLIAATGDLDSGVELAACEALSATSGAGFESRRAEDWWGWWTERGGAPVTAP